jgi:hypothetical protein
MLLLFVHLTLLVASLQLKQPAGEPRRQADQCHARWRRTAVPSCSTVTQDLARYAPSQWDGGPTTGREAAGPEDEQRAGRPARVLASVWWRRQQCAAPVDEGPGSIDRSIRPCPRALLITDYWCSAVKQRGSWRGGRAWIEQRRAHHKKEEA